MSQTLNRRFPKSGTEITYSRRQMLELNIMLMQVFFPEPFTQKEIEVLVAYCMVHIPGTNILSRPNKAEVVKRCNLKGATSLNEYNKRLRNKYGFIYSKGEWILNPVLYLPAEAEEVTLIVNIKQRDVLDTGRIQEARQEV